MKICERALDFFQIYNANGDVRICSWTKDGYIGNLIDNSISELYCNEKAQKIRNRHIDEDYSLCDLDACPYLAMDEIEEHKVIYEERSYPKKLFLGFERVCNYKCRCCTVHSEMKRNIGKDLERYYDKIEQEINKVLPYVNSISANGCGELFVSKRILRLLKNWKPLYPKEDVKVFLETNGSLFDEVHWKQIENLGQYHLSVSISIMSFDEEIYQFLSGTKLPISQIENNLRFVKKLREEGIINYLEIATVVQEQNFRGVPEFARKCVEEYGADYVRLRPYETWGVEKPEVAWFTDIRNPEHPYYEEYKRVMSHPYLSHTKVHDWSGGRNTESIVKIPYVTEIYKGEIIKDIVLNFDNIVKNEISGKGSIYIYGLSNVGKVLIKEMQLRSIKVEAIIDKQPKQEMYSGVPILSLEQAKKLQQDSVVIITPILYDKEIIGNLLKLGLTRYISVKDFVSDTKLREKMYTL